MPGWLCKIWKVVANILGKIVDFIMNVLEALVDLAVKAIDAVVDATGSLLSGPAGWLLLGAGALALWYFFGGSSDDESNTSPSTVKDSRPAPEPYLSSTQASRM